LFAFIFTFLFASPIFAQDANQAALLAQQREAEERYNRLVSRLENMEEAYQVLSRRIATLAQADNEFRQEVNTRLVAIDNKIRTSQSAAATRDDLKTLTEKLKEVDEKREADKKLILEKLKDLAATVANTPAPTQVIVRPPERTKVDHAPTPSDTKATDSTPAPPANPNGYWTYKVQKGDTLLAIMQAYNAKLREEKKPTLTLDQIKQANPTVNPNALRLNQEVLIPIPGDK
jgi:uncharacterized protein YhaN